METSDFYFESYKFTNGNNQPRLTTRKNKKVIINKFKNENITIKEE
jgi:hypothetical protein